MTSAARARTRRGAGQHDEENEMDERWAVSYVDMLMTLVALFVVLFSMSSIDAAKYQQVADGFKDAFGSDKSATATVIAEGDDEEEEDITEQAQQEYMTLDDLKEQLETELQIRGLENTVEFVIDERGLQVGLVGTETFFSDNSTALSAKANDVLAAIGVVLDDVTNEISVEGHADYRSSTYPYETNWELSSGRATQVARYLVEQNGIAGARVKAVGFSDTRPQALGTTPADLAKNRRVDIVVESDAPESVRALIPSINEATAGK